MPDTINMCKVVCINIPTFSAISYSDITEKCKQKVVNGEKRGAMNMIQNSIKIDNTAG